MIFAGLLVGIVIRYWLVPKVDVLLMVRQIEAENRTEYRR